MIITKEKIEADQESVVEAQGDIKAVETTIEEAKTKDTSEDPKARSLFVRQIIRLPLV